MLLSSSPGQVGLATLVSALPFLLYFGAATLAIASATDSSPLRRRRNYLLIVVLVFLALGSSSLLLAVAGIPPIVLAARPVKEGRAARAFGNAMLKGLDPDGEQAGSVEQRIAEIRRRADDPAPPEEPSAREGDGDQPEADPDARRNSWADIRDAVTTRAATVAGAVALPVILWFLLFVVSDRMWVPLEVVTTDDRAVVGYVIQEGDWLSVMADSDREITRLRNDDVASRTICQTKATSTPLLGRPLASILWSKNAPEYPACSDLATP